MKITKPTSLAISPFLFSRILIPVFLVCYFCLGTVLYLIITARASIKAYIKEVIGSFQSFVNRKKEEEAYLEFKSRLKKFLP